VLAAAAGGVDGGRGSIRRGAVVGTGRDAGQQADQQQTSNHVPLSPGCFVVE
jgi:hypothetical protein